MYWIKAIHMLKMFQEFNQSYTKSRNEKLIKDCVVKPRFISVEFERLKEAQQHFNQRFGAGFCISFWAFFILVDWLQLTGRRRGGAPPPLTPKGAATHTRGKSFDKVTPKKLLYSEKRKELRQNFKVDQIGQQIGELGVLAHFLETCFYCFGFSSQLIVEVHNFTKIVLKICEVWKGFQPPPPPTSYVLYIRSRGLSLVMSPESISDSQCLGPSLILLALKQ